jgi:hypothetical protein
MINEEEDGEDLFLVLACLGPVLATAELACDFASLVLKRYEGEDGLLRQQPLYAFDQGDTWIIRGSSKEAFGTIIRDDWYMVARKDNCKILTIARELPRNCFDISESST